MDRPPLLCFLVDAFRPDYVSRRRTPFMAELVAEGEAAPLPTILGYSDAIRATIFTGAYPDEHGYWMEYCFRPERSPFRGIDWLAPLDRVPVDVALRAAKFALSGSLMRILARSRGYSSLSLRNIPFGALPFFDYTLSRPMTAPDVLDPPTIFDRCREAGVRWAYLDSSRMRGERLLRAVETLPSDVGFVFVYLHHIDMASHLFGMGSERFDAALGRVDGLMRRIRSMLTARRPGWNTLVFSDHGMSPVERAIGLPDLIRHPAFGTRFCFALDATMVRLWYLDDDDRLREELRGRIVERVPGWFLTERELTELHLRFAHRLYGDEIFLVEPGTVIFPNFHSYLRPKAMHAYHPADPDQHGIVVASTDLTGDAPGVDRLIDLAPLMSRAMGLEPVPSPAQQVGA